MKRINVYSSANANVKLTSAQFEASLLTVDELEKKIEEMKEQFIKLYSIPDTITVEHELIEA